MANDNINKQFSDAFNGIANAYNAAEESDIVTLNQCVYSARGLLSQPSIPRHILIQTLILLARILVDHDEARRYHREAEITLARVRAYESKDPNRSADVDAVLRELQESLEEVGGYLSAEEEVMKALRAAAIAREEEATAATKREEVADKREELDVLGLPNNDEGLDLMRRITALKVDPKVRLPRRRPQLKLTLQQERHILATKEEMEQITEDWDGKSNETLRDTGTADNPAVITLARLLQGALGREDYNQYYKIRVVLTRVWQAVAKEKKANAPTAEKIAGKEKKANPEEKQKSMPIRSGVPSR